MFDSFNRSITYLRISITDRCNLRCRYCMPEEGIKLLPRNEILSFEEIIHFTQTAASMGITKVRLTGGEPLVREGVVSLVKGLANIPEIREVSLTSNGIKLAAMANELADAGLQRINISLDSVDPGHYRTITRGGDLNAVLRGIDAALRAGLTPVKINCVIKESASEEDAQGVSEYGKKMGLQVRFIRQMDLQKGVFYHVEGGDGGNCTICNRLRLTASGFVKPCLFSNKAYNIRELGAENAIRQAVLHKPKCGTMNHMNEFYNIGG